MTSTGVVVLKRRKGGWRDRIRGYSVLIDGERAEKVKHGETVEIPIEAGKHRIKLKLDWGASPELEFEAGAGDRVCFYCYPNQGVIADIPDVVQDLSKHHVDGSPTVLEGLLGGEEYIALHPIPSEADLLPLK